MRHLLSGSALVLSMWLVACGPETNVEQSTASVQGRLSEESGSSGAPDAANEAPLGFAGKGTLTAAATVRVVRVADDGAQTVLSQAVLRADGSYAAKVPVNAQGLLLVEAVDTYGRVVGRAVVSKNPGEGQARIVEPMTTESSVEARVVLELAAQGHAGQVDLAGLRARIDERLAMAVTQLGAEQVDAQIRAVATAAWAAQRVEDEAWADVGVTLETRRGARLDVLAQLDAQLDAQTLPEAAAQADFLAQLATTEVSRNELAIDARAGVSASASAASRRVMARAGANADVAVSWSTAVAQVEGTAAAASLMEVLRAQGAAEAQLSAARTQNQRLLVALSDARSEAAVSAAFDAWRAGVRGTTEGDAMGLLGRVWLTLQAALLSTCVTEAHEVSVSLAARYDDAVTAAQGLFGLDAQAVATASVSIDGQFRADVSTAVQGTLGTSMGETDQRAMASLLVVTEGAWR